MLLFLLVTYVVTFQSSISSTLTKTRELSENCSRSYTGGISVSSERAENEVVLELNHKSIAFFPLLLTMPRSSSLIFHCHWQEGEAQSSQVINQSIILGRQLAKCQIICFQENVSALVLETLTESNIQQKPQPTACH